MAHNLSLLITLLKFDSLILEKQTIIALSGTTIAAANDTQLPGGSGCFAGVGQTASTASGGDLAYRFTAPRDGRYSFRVTGFDAARNAVLYVASDCPAGAAPATIAGCLGAANRNAAYPDEEVNCLSMSAGQSVYAYVDEHLPTSGGSFVFEANPCDAEAEPNGSPSSAGELACGVEGAITPAGDADFFVLGVPGSGSRVTGIPGYRNFLSLPERETPFP